MISSMEANPYGNSKLVIVPSNMKSLNYKHPSLCFVLFLKKDLLYSSCVFEWVCMCVWSIVFKCLSPPPFRKSRVSRMLWAASPLSLQPDPCSWEPFQTSPILSYEQVPDPRLYNQSPNWVPDPSHPQGICLVVGAVPPLGFGRAPSVGCF